MVRSRAEPVYTTETTESERSFEHYIPRRERRERRRRRNSPNLQGRLTGSAWTLDTVSEEGWGGDYDPPRTSRSQRSRLDSNHETSRLRTASPSEQTTGLTGGLECKVCFDEKLRNDFPFRRVTKKCNHEPTDCCNSCLTQAIRTAFEGNMWDDIRCPICNEQLEFQDMAELAPPNIFER